MTDVGIKRALMVVLSTTITISTGTNSSTSIEILRPSSDTKLSAEPISNLLLRRQHSGSRLLALEAHIVRSPGQLLQVLLFYHSGACGGRECFAGLVSLLRARAL